MKTALVGAECEENLASRYIQAALEAKGHEVIQVEFNSPADTESAAQRLADSGASLAGISMVFTYRAREFAALASRSRELGYRGHLVAGGHFAAFNCRELLRDVAAFDSVGIGEGEQLMCNLAENLDELARVPGLVWRCADGRVCHNPPAEKPTELDRLPWPVRMEPPDAYLGLPIANLLASRGCTHSCAFCSIAAWHKLCGGPRLRLREPVVVAQEMATLYARGYRIFNFHDDNFFLPSQRQNLQRFWRLRGELKARGVDRIAFAVKSRPDTVDEETFAFLKEFGLFRVFLGIEAGTADSLSRLGRGQVPEQNERALDIVNRLDLHATFNLLLLNPDSTLEDFRANVDFLRKHANNPMNFCRTEIYAGTPLEERLRQEHRLLGDYWGYNYLIRDERAESAFRLIYLGMGGRHIGEDCTHHLTMRVDFERQLLSQFWGCPESLRQRVKSFIRRVNLNSCDYLDEIADAADSGSATAEDQEEFLRNISARVQRDNQGFATEGSQLVAEINQISQPEKRRSHMWQQDAAALLLTSLALSGTACDPVPRPATPIPHPGQTSPQAVAHLRDELGIAVPRALSTDLGEPATAVDLDLAVDNEGKVRMSQALRLDAKPLRLSMNSLPTTQIVLKELSIKDPALRNRTWTIRYTAAEISAAGIKTYQTEMAPLPPTQMFEMAPRPPREK